MKKRTSRQGVKFGGKIKTEHTIIQGLLEPLQRLAECPAIKSIIPGRIQHRGSSGSRPQIRLSIPTATGWKAIAKVQGTTQELFIVTDSPDVVKKLLSDQEG